jgi:hypothetical protein
MHGPTPINLQFVVGILSSILVAGAWWYIALRLPYHWITYGLAILATAGAFTSLGIVVLIESHQSLVLLPPLSYLRTAVGLLEAALYIAFAAWITSGTKANSGSA